MNYPLKGSNYPTLNRIYNLDDAVQRLKAAQNSENYWRGNEEKKRDGIQTYGDGGEVRGDSQLSFEKDLLKQHLQVMNDQMVQFEFFILQNEHAKKQNYTLTPTQTHFHHYPTQLEVQETAREKLCRKVDGKSIGLNGMPVSLSNFIMKLVKTREWGAREALMVIGRVLWQKYSRERDRPVQLYRILNYSQQILESLQLECQNLLFWRHLTPADREYFLNFLQIYSATLLLVFNQYFQNPYYDPPSSRRLQDSDEELDFSNEEDVRERRRANKKLHRDSIDAL